MAKNKMSEFTRWRMESKNKPKLADKALEVAAREAYETWTYLHDSQPNWGKATGTLASQLRSSLGVQFKITTGSFDFIIDDIGFY